MLSNMKLDSIAGGGEGVGWISSMPVTDSFRAE